MDNKLINVLIVGGLNDKFHDKYKIFIKEHDQYFDNI